VTTEKIEGTTTRTEIRKYFQKYKKVHRYCTFESTLFRTFESNFVRKYVVHVRTV